MFILFYFLATRGDVVLGAFISLSEDTFWIERSLTYRAALRRRKDAIVNAKSVVDSTIARSRSGPEEKQASGKDMPSQPSSVENGAATDKGDSGLDDVNLSFSDINSFPPLWIIMRRRNNITILMANAVIYVHANVKQILRIRPTFDRGSSPPTWSWECWKQCEWWSMVGPHRDEDENKNEGRWYPKMHSKNATLAMVWLPLSVIGYAWVAEKHVTVGVVCLMLFLCGFSPMWMYAGTLAYVVDENTGRPGSAVAAKSSFRGTLAFVSTMAGVPLQDAVGDGWLYTGFAVLVVVMELLIVLVLRKRVSWREA